MGIKKNNHHQRCDKFYETKELADSLTAIYKKSIHLSTHVMGVTTRRSQSVAKHFRFGNTDVTRSVVRNRSFTLNRPNAVIFMAFSISSVSLFSRAYYVRFTNLTALISVTTYWFTITHVFVVGEGEGGGGLLR